MKHYLLAGLLMILAASAQPQCLDITGERNESFPVTNRFNTFKSPFNPIIYRDAAKVFNIVSNKGTYYLMGNFANLTANHGPALVVDTATGQIRTTQQWRVNGPVTAAIPDGQGGFYIIGSFTKIGDSARQYLAQIDGLGKPTAWNPRPNKEVKAIEKRNDTLFIAGGFTNIFSRSRVLLALYSISGDSLLNTRNTYSFSTMGVINTFLLQKDTLIYAGESGTGMYNMGKFNFKDSVHLSWQALQYGAVKKMCFNKDSSLIVYVHNYNSGGITIIRNSNHQFLYMLEPKIGISATPDIYSLKTAGDKAYVAGYFESIAEPAGGITLCKGFFTFDIPTGRVTPTDLQMDGYPTFLDFRKDRLLVSGKFTTVLGADRYNFAEIDTAGKVVTPWQLSPSDDLTAIAFSEGNAFVAGEFNGIYAARRNGFAAIDSATNAILPWTATNTSFAEGKRMFIKGDTLFVLGITNRTHSCVPNDFSPAFQLFSLITGQPLSRGDMGFSTMYDFIIDSNYLYASVDNQLRRYSLPSLQRDLSWGTPTSYTLTYLLLHNNILYAVGDNRFENICTNLPQRYGYFTQYNKQTGLPVKIYSYRGEDLYYNHIAFDHAVMANNRLYIHGKFSSLNGKARNNFACIDVSTGDITNWQVSRSDAVDGFALTSELKLQNGRIWFGGAATNDVSSPYFFPGLASIDTTTGFLLPAKAALQSDYSEDVYKSKRIHDFLFAKDHFIGVGDFDRVSGTPSGSMVQFKVATATPPVSSGIQINGPDVVDIKNSPHQYFVQGAVPSSYAYCWAYSTEGTIINGNRADTISLQSTPFATSGLLTVTAQNACGSAPALTKAISVLPPAVPVKPVVTGVKDMCIVFPYADGKLQNPPRDAAITITLDGANLAYMPADSSFRYYSKGTTSFGQHALVVKYANTSGNAQTDTSFILDDDLDPFVGLYTPSTTVCKGEAVTFTASVYPSNSKNRVYKWYVNGNLINNSTDTYTTDTLTNNALVKVTVTGSAICDPLFTVSGTVTMNVQSRQASSITISGTTTVLVGTAVSLTAVAVQAGGSPEFQWQDSTASHGWQNIGGAVSNALTYTPAATGDKVRCMMKPSVACPVTAYVTSNELTFTVNLTTGITPVPAAAYGIRSYPTAVNAILTLEGLRASDKWGSVEVFAVDGKEVVMSTKVTSGQTKVLLHTDRLTPGYYIAVLRSTAGISAYFKFIKL